MYRRGEYKMTIANKKITMDKRINERRPYSGHIFFTAKNGFNEGRLKDYSKSGLFIITKAHLSLGEIITVAIPYANDKRIKCKGQIMRRDRDGFGIDLFRKRQAAII
jgi:flagellar basal body L-ring protein FlgH